MKLWSAAARGFFSPEIHASDQIPGDAVEITDADHAALLTAQAAGQVIDAGGDGVPVAVDPPAPPIADACAAAKRAVDAAAETARLAFITPGAGQAMVYERKAQEAEAAAADPAPDPIDYPLLAAEVGITGPDLQAVAATVLATRDQWLAVAGQIEATRLGAKAAIDAAADGAAIDAVLAGLAWPTPS